MIQLLFEYVFTFLIPPDKLVGTKHFFKFSKEQNISNVI